MLVLMLGIRLLWNWVGVNVRVLRGRGLRLWLDVAFLKRRRGSQKKIFGWLGMGGGRGVVGDGAAWSGRGVAEIEIDGCVSVSFVWCLSKVSDGAQDLGLVKSADTECVCRHL